MYTQLCRNPYIVPIICFILLCVLFYLIDIYHQPHPQPFNWRYPLAISLIFWLFWNFYVCSPLNNDHYITPFTSEIYPIHHLTIETKNWD